MFYKILFGFEGINLLVTIVLNLLIGNGFISFLLQLIAFGWICAIILTAIFTVMDMIAEELGIDGGCDDGGE